MKIAFDDWSKNERAKSMKIGNMGQNLDVDVRKSQKGAGVFLLLC